MLYSRRYFVERFRRSQKKFLPWSLAYREVIFYVLIK